MRRAVFTTLGVAAIGFAVSFGAMRALTYSIHVGVGPFHDVSTGGTHIHHMVWGILLVLAVGYVRLLGDSAGTGSAPVWLARLMAFGYAAGAALTLDEFALWLHMRDVYWQAEGWESVIAVAIFATLLVAGWWSRAFLQRAARRLVRRRTLPRRASVE